MEGRDKFEYLDNNKIIFKTYSNRDEDGIDFAISENSEVVFDIQVNGERDINKIINLSTILIFQNSSKLISERGISSPDANSITKN